MNEILIPFAHNYNELTKWLSENVGQFQEGLTGAWATGDGWWLKTVMVADQYDRRGWKVFNQKAHRKIVIDDPLLATQFKLRWME